MKADELRSVQRPLKERYQREPEAALITLTAQGRLGEGVSCNIETGRALVKAGFHPATGGSGMTACSSSLRRFKRRVRKLICYRRGVTVEQMIEQLNRYLIGWRGYFGYCQTRSILQVLDCRIRRRLRCVYCRRWKRGIKRFAELKKLDIRKDLVARAAGSIHSPWRLSRSVALSYAFPNAHFDSLGLALLAK